MGSTRWFFRVLLLTWPRRVRREEGPELEDMFIGCLEEARQRSGTLGMALALARGALDTLIAAPAVHAAERWETQPESMDGDPEMMLRPGTVGHGLMHLGRDVRYALRVLARERAFTLTAILTLAICLAANAVAFGIVRSVLLRPLDIPEPDRIVLLSNIYPNAGFSTVGPMEAATGVPDYFDRLRETTVFESQALYNRADVTLGIPDGAERVTALRATPSIFPLLRARPALGGLFATDSVGPAATAEVIVSHGFWRRHFGGDPTAIGRTVLINGVGHRVAGVMRSDFRYLWDDVELWLPRTFTAEERSDERRHSNNWVMIARLKPGATIGQAEREIDALNIRNSERFPHLAPLLRDAGFRTLVNGLQETMVRDVRPTLYMLWGGALLVLLVGAANLANLFLVRATTRTREFATRHALGAGLGRLTSQLLSEATLLTVVAGVLGIAAGWWVVRLLAAARLDLLPRGSEIALDWQTAIVVITLAVVLGIVMGFAPVARVRRMGIHHALREGGRAESASGAARRTRSALAVGQVALAFVVLVGAGLLLESFRRVLHLDPGFRPGGVITAAVNLPASAYGTDSALINATERLLGAIRALPGVTAAGITTSVPFSGDYNSSVILAEGYQLQGTESLVSPHLVTASAGYFEAMGIPLVAGRYFDRTDAPSSQSVIIIDKRLAAHFWPGQNPIGRRMYFPSSIQNPLAITESTRWFTIVGIVGDVQLTGLAPASPMIGSYYLASTQSVPRFMTFAIRSTSDPTALVPAVRNAVSSIDRNLPVFGVQTMDDRLDHSLVFRRVPLLLAVGFGSVALLLATIGVYGVLAYQVVQRRRELGIRLALGSSPGDVFRLVLRDGAWITVVGLGIGAIGAFAVVRLIARLLYGVAPTDPGVFAGVGLLVAFIALAASVIPARRATRIDPVRALNEQG